MALKDEPGGGAPLTPSPFLPVGVRGTMANPYSAPAAPVAAPTAPSGGNSFDSDPRVAMAKALENQGIGQLDSWIRSAREQAIIQSGDPDLAGQAGFGLDPQAGVFARQNYLSGNADLARLDRAKKLAHRAIINKLASRGILRSGDLGYLEGEANQDFGNQEYDVRQGVLSKLSEFMRQYLQQKQALKQSTLGAYQDAYNNADLTTGAAPEGGTSPDVFAPLGNVPVDQLLAWAAKQRSRR